MPQALSPKPGFDWTQVSWGGPDEPAAEICSYCDDEIPEDAAPLMLFNSKGWCAKFCDTCAATWFGARTFGD